MAHDQPFHKGWERRKSGASFEYIRRLRSFSWQDTPIATLLLCSLFVSVVHQSMAWTQTNKPFCNRPTWLCNVKRVTDSEDYQPTALHLCKAFSIFQLIVWFSVPPTNPLLMLPDQTKLATSMDHSVAEETGADPNIFAVHSHDWMHSTLYADNMSELCLQLVLLPQSGQKCSFKA